MFDVTFSHLPTMSLVPLIKDMHNPAIGNLIQVSLESKDERLRLESIPCSQITDIKSAQIDNIYYAIYKRTLDKGGVEDTTIMLVLLGNDETCTPTYVSEFARIYSLPTHTCNNDVSQYRRYKIWLEYRNQLIKGFTEYDGNYYMVAGARFYHCYSRYGFCAACGIFRCSPVWCICGHKQLSDGWTSNNKRLDDFIKKTQLQTNSADDAYLEWISDACISVGEYLYGLPTAIRDVTLVRLEITDETPDLYYAELCDEHPDILVTDVWATIGFTYKASEQKYCLIRKTYRPTLCLACTMQFYSKIKSFCYRCKAPRPLNWTTGNKSLDLFIMESWHNATSMDDEYIQWIEYSRLSNVQEMLPLRHGCTLIADWLESTNIGLTRVTLKKIVDGDDQSFDFHQLIKEYPEILTPDYFWIIRITQEPSTRGYYLVFYHDVHAVVDRLMRLNDDVTIKYMQYGDFYKLKEIGSGSYKTAYTAKYRRYSEVQDMRETNVLIRFKRSDETDELFITEFRNYIKCSDTLLLDAHGVTQVPETNDYIIVMECSDASNLWSYLGQKINDLTWKDKLMLLWDMSSDLDSIHCMELVHCNFHAGNIVFETDFPMICDLGLSRSVKSHKSSPNIRGVLPFIAPEVFRTRKFTKESDVYSFGVILYLIAAGELSFKNRQFDRDLVCDIMRGLRPSMPESAPEEYKKIAEWCCDADPNKRPDTITLYKYFENIYHEFKEDSAWLTIYHNDVKPLSRLSLEKES